MSGPRKVRLAVVVQTWAGSVALMLASACADEPTQPPASEAAPAVSAVLPINAEQRGQLRSALMFAREQSSLALAREVAGERISAAFTELGERVEANDRVGVEQMIAAARAALARYADFAGEGERAGSAADIESLAITLDQTAELIRKADASRGEGGRSRETHRRTNTTSESSQRIQP